MKTLKDKNVHAKYTYKLNLYLRLLGIEDLPEISEDCAREVSAFMDKGVKDIGPRHREYWGHDLHKIMAEDEEYFGTSELKVLIGKYGLLPIKISMVKHCLQDEYATELQQEIRRKLSREISERQAKHYRRIPPNLMFLKGQTITADVREFDSDRYIYLGGDRKNNTAIGRGEISEPQRKIISAYLSVDETPDFYTVTLTIAIQQFNDVYDLLRYIHEKYSETQMYLTVNYLVGLIDKFRNKILEYEELKEVDITKIRDFIRENSPYPEHKKGKLRKMWITNTLRCLLEECNAYLEEEG